jgi:hypothetical protein
MGATGECSRGKARSVVNGAVRRAWVAWKDSRQKAVFWLSAKLMPSCGSGSLHEALHCISVCPSGTAGAMTKSWWVKGRGSGAGQRGKQLEMIGFAEMNAARLTRSKDPQPCRRVAVSRLTRYAILSEPTNRDA